MERLTYVAENGEVLFHPADLPDDEGITLPNLRKMEDTKPWKRLRKDLQIESKPRSRDYFCGCRARLEIRCMRHTEMENIARLGGI